MAVFYCDCRVFTVAVKSVYFLYKASCCVEEQHLTVGLQCWLHLERWVARSASLRGLLALGVRYCG